MSNAERILQRLDQYLNHEVPLVIYGRAAVALGFKDPPEVVKHSLDVDVIVRAAQTEALRADENFWQAQETANRDLEKDGLYITHLFEADQIFLRRDWEQYLVPIQRPMLRWLRLFRPSTVDLILTKMMRGDDQQDMEDVAFLIRHDSITSAQIEAAFSDAVIPDLEELREAFERAKPRVRELARKASPR
jgi:hypothetical protein